MSRELDYILGFAYGDGTLYKHPEVNKHRLCFYQNDPQILRDISQYFHEYFGKAIPIRDRTRSTSFAEKCVEYSLRTSSKEITSYFIGRGLPSGKKSDILQPPILHYELDFLRGYIDADGSLGVTGKGIPFVSVVVSSDPFKEWFCKKVEEITGYLPNPNRNSRDKVYNICIYREKAQLLADAVYRTSTIRIERKYRKYLEIMEWTRPSSMRKSGVRKTWTSEEDAIVLDESIPLEHKLNLLGRSLSSYRNRKFRLLAPPSLKGGWTIPCTI